eukprot:3312207-Rhodomonas_salina.3
MAFGRSTPASTCSCARESEQEQRNEDAKTHEEDIFVRREDGERVVDVEEGYLGDRGELLAELGEDGILLWPTVHLKGEEWSSRRGWVRPELNCRRRKWAWKDWRRR